MMPPEARRRGARESRAIRNATSRYCSRGAPICATRRGAEQRRRYSENALKRVRVRGEYIYLYTHPQRRAFVLSLSC